MELLWQQRFEHSNSTGPKAAPLHVDCFVKSAVGTEFGGELVYIRLDSKGWQRMDLHDLAGDQSGLDLWTSDEEMVRFRSADVSKLEKLRALLIEFGLPR